MSGSNRIRVQRILREVEGYLEINMPLTALEVLNRLKEPGTFRGQQLYLTGEALRALERYQDALVPLEQAADLQPSNLRVWLALGWCYKRAGQLELAIDALQRGEEVAPDEAIVPYNLACYWSLAGKKELALNNLSRAIAMDPNFRDMIHDEPDFDPLRSDPEFRALTEIIV